jgi:hypothetical protein
MKEPGDQELVVSRGPDGEDVAMPEASADDDDDDDDRTADDTHGNNINLNLPPRAYSPMPHLPTDSPLLVGETTPDPRGDAPAYFEAVQQDDNTIAKMLAENTQSRFFHFHRKHENRNKPQRKIYSDIASHHTRVSQEHHPRSTSSHIHRPEDSTRCCQ